MIEIFLISFPLLFVAAHGHVSGDVTEIQCQGEIKVGQLEISEKFEEYKQASYVKIPEGCTSLEIRGENGTEINWEKIPRIPLPKLKTFKLYLTTMNHNFNWNMISLFGYSPKEISKLGIDSFLYYDDINVLNFDAPFKYLSIRTIDPKPILKTFLEQDVQLKTLYIGDTKVSGTEFTPPDGVTTMILDADQIENFSTFIQKFNYLEDLTLQNFHETIDIGDILLYPKYLKNLAIEKCSLTLKDVTHQSQTLKMLTLTDSISDTFFKENAWKVMPNLLTFKHSAIEKIDLKDILVYKQLTHISLALASLTFTKPVEQYTTLETLELTSCELDLANFAEVTASTFPNLTFLSLDSTLGGTKPTQNFLNDILAKIPDIQRVSLDPFDLEPRDRKGTFEIIYRYNPSSVE